jgi:uncharacterized protein YecT (DUF1311 family)
MNRCGTACFLSFFLLLFLMAPSLSLFSQSPQQRQDTARAALQTEMVQEGRDCPDTKSQSALNICIEQVRDANDRDFAVFYGNLFSLLARDPANQKGLQTAEEQWLSYRTQSCAAIDYLYRDGTIRSSAVARCEIQLTRSRMRDLDSLYQTVLHL